MKKLILRELMKHASGSLPYQEQQRWKKRLKYAAVISVVAVLLVTGVAVWGVVSIASKVAGAWNQEAVRTSLVANGEKLTSITERPLTTPECLSAAGKTLSAHQLLTIPLADNIGAIREACWDKPRTSPEPENESSGA